MTRPGLTKIGTTVGLAADTCERGGKPEQVYVYIKDEDAVRPVLIEGWVGYGIDQKLQLTRRQAKELIPLLLEALLQQEAVPS